VRSRFILAEAYPNRAFDLNKTQSTMILGEGAGVCCLENGKKKNILYRGYRYATEVLEHTFDFSEATCFQKSMKMALENTDLSEVDVVVICMPWNDKRRHYRI
jgi:hypothetical protein